MEIHNFSAINVMAERAGIPYRPELKRHLGNTNACIFLQQCIYWWTKMGGESFYKFNGPCDHENYRAGDSWQEELAFSRKELFSAREFVSIKKTSSMSMDDARKLSKISLKPVIYWTDAGRQTHYTIHAPALIALLDTAYDHAPKVPKGDLATDSAIEQSPEKGFTQQSPERGFTQQSPERGLINTEITTKTTLPEIISEEAGAVAPAAAPEPSGKSKKTRKRKKKPEPVEKSEAVKAFRNTHNLYPTKTQQSLIDDKVVDVPRWQKVVEAWAGQGHRPQNVTGQLDWYRDGIPDYARPQQAGSAARSNGRRTTAQPDIFCGYDISAVPMSHRGIVMDCLQEGIPLQKNLQRYLADPTDTIEIQAG